MRSLTQIAGRAARHPEGRVILYADQITDSMRATIEQSNRRRATRRSSRSGRRWPPTSGAEYVAAAPTEGELERRIDETRRQMEEAAKALDFILAAKLRDKMYELMKQKGLR